MTIPRDNLRPTTLDDVVGQDEVVQELRIKLASAQARDALPEHLLFIGPAGTGKTTLSLCVANAVGGRLLNLMGPNLRTEKDIVLALVGLQARDTVFIDEIHRMWRPVQEMLYPLVEDGVLIDNGQRFEKPPHLWIGATTDPERLQTPMLDRFTTLRLRLYEVDELAEIVKRAAAKLKVGVTDEAATAIGQAAEGVPRVALRLLKASRDYAYAGHRANGGEIFVLAHAVGNKAKVDVTYPTDPITIAPENVSAVLASTAYVWRQEGRDAG